MAPTSALPTAVTRAVRHPGARLAILALAILLIAHDLTYAAGHGIEHVALALSGSGHDPYWRWIGLAGIGVVALLIVGAALRWRMLRARLTQLRDGIPGAHGRRLGLRSPSAREVIGLWLRLLAVALALFLVQENLEHYLAHAGHLPLLGVLVERGYLAALPAFALVALLVAGLAAAVEVRLTDLQRAVAIAECWSRPRAAGAGLEPAARAIVRRRTNSLATPDLGRAPPLASMT